MTGYTYIAGPMTGIEDYNYPAFHEAAKALRASGIMVINPAENFDGDQSLPYTQYIRLAVKQMASASHVVTLDGWEDSDGAVLEVTIANALDLPVTRYEDWKRL